MGGSSAQQVWRGTGENVVGVYNDYRLEGTGSSEKGLEVPWGWPIPCEMWSLREVPYQVSLWGSKQGTEHAWLAGVGRLWGNNGRISTNYNLKDI